MLHKHLLNLLTRETTKLYLRPLKGDDGALVDFDDYFPPAYVNITVDANNGETLRFVIHELIHVTISELVLGKFDETLEEVLVLGLETDLHLYITSNRARLARWTKTIEAKLAAANPDAEPTPYRELVDRPKG